MTFTEAEQDYLTAQRLGRLATIAADSTPQNSPVGFRLNAALGTVDIYGYDLAASRKYRNVRANSRVSLVVDDIFSTDPWRVRGVEIRGYAEALGEQSTPQGLSPEVIRIHPRRILSWGLDPRQPELAARTVVADVPDRSEPAPQHSA